MAQVMDTGMRLARPLMEFKQPDHLLEFVMNNRMSQLSAVDRNKYVTIGSNHLSPQDDVFL
jgi:hypothetical protein